MNAQDFCFWLQGYLEVSQAKEVDEQKLRIIKDHLALVFDKKTPDYDWILKPMPNVEPYTIICESTKDLKLAPSASIVWNQRMGGTYCCSSCYSPDLKINLSC